MDIRSKAVEPAAWLHLRDSADELMYDTKTAVVDGVEQEVPDLDKPVRVHLHSPGSKAYARAQAAKNNRMLEKIRKKGKLNDSAEQQAEESAAFLVDCTIAWDNLDYPGVTELAAKSKAVYTDTTIGFIPEQVGKFLGEWGNFSLSAQKP